MIQKYKFEGENDFIEFDDSKSVKELINYAFDKFDYFEPAGIEIVICGGQAALVARGGGTIRAAGQELIIITHPGIILFQQSVLIRRLLQHFIEEIHLHRHG